MRRPWGCLAALAALLLPHAPVGEGAKPRPQRALPYQPWREGLPSARSNFGMARAADGSVWVFGGYTGDAGWIKISAPPICSFHTANGFLQFPHRQL